MRSRVRAAAVELRDSAREQSAELTVWAVTVAAGLALTAVAVAHHLRVGSAAAPFSGRYRSKVEIGSPLAALVAGVALFAVALRVQQHLRWRLLLVGSTVTAFAWSVALALVDGGNGLASPVTDPQEYLADVAAVRGSPHHYLGAYVQHLAGAPVAVRGHPPGPVLLLWAVGHVGIRRPETLGLVITAIGALTVPCVGSAVAGLCGPAAGRRLLPVLALAPYAVWVAVSMDAVTMTLTSAALACGVRASAGRRAVPWAVAAGLLLGAAALFGYAVAWLGVSLIAVYFVRRRVLLNVVTAAAGLLPLTVARVAGFTWPDGLHAAQVDFAHRVAPYRSGLLWAALDILLALIACGPALVAALRRVRSTPGWPFLVGSGAATVFAVVSGLARGEVERSWLPFFPWLLVPVSAARRTPLLLVAAGAVTGVVVEAAVHSPW